MNYQRPFMKSSFLVLALGMAGWSITTPLWAEQDSSMLSIYDQPVVAASGDQEELEGVAGARGQRGRAMTTTSTSLRRHQVGPGDSLSSVARKNGVSVAALLAANSLKDPNQLKVGQVLRIPGKAAPKQESGLASHPPERQRSEPQVTNRTGGESRRFSYYRVRSGDTITKISNRLGVNSSALMKANGLSSPRDLRAGQTLTIPGQYRRDEDSSIASQDSRPREAPERPSTRQAYEVKGSDTFYSLSRKYGVSVDEIMAANPGVNPNSLRPGQRLMIPLRGGSAVSQSQIPRQREMVEQGEVNAQDFPNPHLRPNELQPLPPRQMQQDPRVLVADDDSSSPAMTVTDRYMDYEVTKGETWDSIARDFRTTKPELRKLNGRGDFDEVRAGQRIQVPRTRFGHRAPSAQVPIY